MSDVAGADRPKTLLEKSLPEEQSFIFYTYSRPNDRNMDRWANAGVPDAFFQNEDEVRQAVAELRKEVGAEPAEDMPSVQIEKIETLPINPITLLALLNDGVGAIVKRYEIVETIE